jgi:DNA polymerase III subunit alpha
VTDFVHLHQHSEYSLLDGMSTPEEIVEIVKANGQFASAITDHGTMSGTFRFHKACKKLGVKAIHGVEAYMVPSIEKDTEDKNAERFHLIVLAKNQEGLYKLFKTQQRAWTSSFYHKPRIDWDDLEFLAGDVVILSGCMASLLCRLLSNEEDIEASTLVKRFRDTFNSDFYIELQPWNSKVLNDQLIDLADSHNIDLVGTIDCHYPTAEDKGLEELLLMMGQLSGLKGGADKYAKEHFESAKSIHDLTEKINHLYPDRKLRFDDIHNYVMSTVEVVKRFNDVGIERDIYSSSVEIAQKCTSELVEHRKLLPKFNVKYDSDWYLREITFLGLQEKGFKDDQRYIDRLNEELDTIQRMGFSDYFLIVWDFVKWADQNGIARGPGRGSVGGCLLAYCLDITKIDSIYFGLPFVRFLNEERVSPPDIDLDFSDKHRNLIKKYAIERWGEDHVASISSFGKFKPKSLVKNIASALRVPYDKMNKLTPKFESLDDLAHIDDGKKFLDEFPEVLPAAKRLQGRIRTNSAHPAGIVISSIPLYEVCPLESRDEKPEGRIKVTAYDMEEAELLGLLKFDLLSVKAIAVIDDCIKIVKERHGLDVERDSLRLDDSDVIDRFNHDSMVGIFQAEGAGYKKLIDQMGIHSFDDLVASNALVRPGAWVTQGAEYLACKSGKKEPEYPHEVVEPVLQETFGTIVYQEQVMWVAHLLCGFSWSESDTLRKIIAKKRDAEEFLPFRERFIDGGQKYISKQAVEKLWSDLEKSAEYQFPKGHAVAYSMISYQTMWLKYYYPQEFIWACLTNEDKNEEVATFLMEARRMGINILGPDINRSAESFSFDGSDLRFGLSNIMGAGTVSVRKIIRGRPYGSVEEFRQRAKVNITLQTNLEKIGGFESVGFDAGYDIKKYYLPVLNCSIYADEDETFKDLLSKVTEVEDNNGIHIVRAVVKETKRKPHFFRVALEDSSGTNSFFCDNRDAEIKSKNYLLAIVGNKSLMAYCDANDNDAPLYEFISRLEKGEFIDLKPHGIGEFGEDKYQAYVMSARKFKTKKGQDMASITLFEPYTGFHKTTVFPSLYGKMEAYMKPLNHVIVKAGNKPEIIDDMITYEKFKELKKI